MKKHFTSIFAVLTFSMASSFAYAGGPAPVAAQAAEPTRPVVNLVALKDFVDHPGYCEIFLGKNTEVDAVVMNYSKAIASVLPTLREGVDGGKEEVNLAMAAITSACLSKSLSVSN